jgi:hypothetical protein
MKLTKESKITALKAAIQSLYTEQVNAYESKISKAVEAFYLNKPKNKKSMAYFKSVPTEYVGLLQLSSCASLAFETNASVSGNIRRCYAQPYVVAKLMASNNGDYIYPFKSSTYNKVNFSKSLLLADCDSPDKEKSAIFCELEAERRALERKIEADMSEFWSALSPIKTLKQLEDSLPTMIKFFPTIDSKGSLVCKELNDKVNARMKAA